MKRPKAAKRVALPKVIVVSEGEVTESIYLVGLRSERRIPKERLVIHAAAGDPKTIVEKAVAEKLANDAQNKLDRIEANDQVWAVFDRDDHHGIPEAKALAQQNGILIAFSNPNFELFLLLHFEDCTREETREVIVRKLRKHIPGYKKHFDYQALGLAAKYPEAKRRAEQIAERSEVIDGIEKPPYCSVIALVDHLKTY